MEFSLQKASDAGKSRRARKCSRLFLFTAAGNRLLPDVADCRRNSMLSFRLPPSKFMRYIRVLLAVFLFAAVIVLILVTALAWWITPDRVGHRIAEALNAHLALNAEFQGPIEIKRLPKLRITLPAAALTHSTDGSAAGRFDAAVIELKPWSFFAESPRIDHILVDGLSYNPKPGTPAASEAANRLSTTLWDVELMELRNSTIAFDAGVFGPAEARLSAIQARLENISEKGGAIRLAGMLESASVSGSASFAGIVRFKDGAGDLLTRFALDSPAVTLDGLWNRRSVHAEVCAKSVAPTGSGWQIESPDARTVFANGPEITAAAPSALLSPETFASDRLSLSAALNTRDGQLSASGTLKAMHRFQPQNTELSQIDLTTRFAPKDASGEATESRLTGNASWSEDGSAEIRLTGTLLGAALSFNASSSPAETEDRRLSLNGDLTLGELSSERLAQLPWDLEWLSLINFRGNISIAGLGPVWGLSDLSAHAELFKGGLILSEGKGDWLGGKTDFAAILTPDGAWHANIRARDGRAESWFSSQNRPAAISGRTDATLALAGSVQTPESPAKLLQADGTVRIASGAFAGFNVPLAFRILADETPDATPPEVRQPHSVSAFNELSFTTAVKDGRLILSEGKASAEGWSASFTGEALSGNLLIHAVFHAPAAGKLPELSLAASAQTGSDLAPVWTAEWDKAAQAVNQARSGEPMTLDRLGRRVERAIKNFWQGLELPDIKMPEIELPDWKLPKMPWEKDEPAPQKPASPAI